MSSELDLNWGRFCLQLVVGAPLFLVPPWVGTIVFSMMFPDATMAPLIGFAVFPTGVVLGASLARAWMVLVFPWFVFRFILARMKRDGGVEERRLVRSKPWWTPVCFQIGPVITGLMASFLLFFQTESTVLALVAPPLLGGLYGAAWLLLLMAGVVTAPRADEDDRFF